MLDASRLALIRRAAAVAAFGALALGVGGPHSGEHGHGTPGQSVTETTAACPGQPNRHFHTPHRIEIRPCPACLLARVGLGEPAARSPVLAAPARLLGRVGVAAARSAGPPTLSRRPRGPPPSLTRS